MISPAFSMILNPMPPVPSLIPVPKTTLVTTTDEDTTLFPAVDIGVPHPKRVVFLAAHPGGSVTVSTAATVNGIQPIARTSISQVIILAFAVPCGLTANVSFTHPGSGRKVVSVSVAYPKSPFPIDSAGALAGTTSPAIATDLKVTPNGFVLYAGYSATTANTLTVTWSGPDAVPAPDYHAVPEAASATIITGTIPLITVGSDLDDVTITALLSGTKAIIAASWGPPA